VVSRKVGVRLYFGTSGKNLSKGKLDAAGTVDYGVGAVQA